MSFLIRQTLIYAIPLMIVALAGIFAERSGIINLALGRHYDLRRVHRRAVRAHSAGHRLL